MSAPSDSSSKPPRKRSRKDSTASSQPQESAALPFTPDETYWYRDGNIVIVAQDVGFRVFKSLLAEASEVFRDMFSVPTPASDVPRVDESDGATPYSIVHVSDTADEFRSLLTILLHGRRYFFHDTDLPFDDLANSIRLAHKYVIQDVLEGLLHELENLYPTEFEPWKVDGPFEESADAIVAVNLARLTNTPSILPSALYLCCQLDIDKLWEGRTRRDGAVDTLSAGDLKRCVVGKVKLATRNIRIVEETFEPAVSRCCTASPSSRCEATLRELKEQLVSHAYSKEDETDALASWKNFITETGDRLLCSSCVRNCIEREKSSREDLWDQLSRLMGLDKK
ncbi:hypothetical protein FOMPIDRAFT_1160535 [Fomitopsis schrenkii]|uniref:BTB domain-containing protein n=1 Tax=Fomitopsis schrenkii TaxID=2126942 RepID=S8FVT8_FOMSC|nr:hypothetical protein FOMPIDRAFT_1160535 [Fomitopsis schrenkii]